MKAANGGRVQRLLDYSHPRLLAAMQPPCRATKQRCQEHDAQAESFQATGEDGISDHDADPNVNADRGEGIPTRNQWIGQCLPRTLLVHGTADTTVPFSQSVEAAASLRVSGVQIITRFEVGGAF